MDIGVINAGGPHAGAWGIVIPTDTAFVVGILAAFGKRLPVQLRSFLVTLAVVDDVGALAVIATAYTGTIRLLPLAGVLLVASALYVVQRARVHRASVYIVFGALLWLLFLASGVHAAIAGVVLGLLMPVFPPERSALLTAEELTQRFRRAPTALTGKNAVYGILRAVSINERHQLSMAPIVNLFVVPVFALSNAGVALSGDALAHALHSPLTWGIVAGLVAGKYVGAFGASVLASKTRIGELAPGLGLRHINGGAMLTGIGFTISLFIIDLAIEDGAAQADARIGVLAASLLAALLGALVLALTAFLDAGRPPGRASRGRWTPGATTSPGTPPRPSPWSSTGNWAASRTAPPSSCSARCATTSTTTCAWSSATTPWATRGPSRPPRCSRRWPPRAPTSSNRCAWRWLACATRRTSTGTCCAGQRWRWARTWRASTRRCCSARTSGASTTTPTTPRAWA